ncbi:geranylgeranyl pyrophosphate synthase [Penicillium robsamsonii]|uniref:geranylgeranyl pyrophosphate synthase n=1 Tax=Penicillium robsamsonii TaxID=1792511 RepID=UPI0025471ED5|nr:geranylgeranyl pyrophosphate synthase [Penicillium robsamsonii]KAJ5807346.1 geranylgeranyl pyrophosphate synthase [Penicillium robsamsonii]
MSTAVMEDIWRYSQPIDPEAVKKTPSFTTLPVRVNKREDVANDATNRSLREWDEALHDGLADRVLVSFSDLGNLGAFAYPEASADRLLILTYLTDLGMLHDDGYEAMDMDSARIEHRELGLLFDPNKQYQPTSGTRAPKIKKLVSKILLEAIDIDHDMGMYMFDMYNKGWLAVAGNAKTWQFDSIEDYQAYRRNDFGATAFWAMTEFAVGVRLSDDDRKLIQPVMEPIEKAVVWTNDYWSFDRENYEAAVNGSRLVNVVEVIRRVGNLSVDEAKAEARRLLVDTEKEYTDRKDVLYAQNPSISPSLKRWVELVGAIVGGTHYWASSAPRHRAWHNKDMAKSADGPVVDTRPFPSHSEGQHALNEDLNDLNSNSGSPSSQQPSQIKPSDCGSPNNQPGSVSVSSTAGTVRKVEENGAPLQSDGSHKVRKVEENGAPLQCDGSHKLPELKWSKPANTALQAPIDYICGMPSKGVRSTLIDAFNYWLKVDETTLENVKELVGFLHNASLILDDIEDCSPKRRGMPATHVLFGQSQVINSANYMFVRAVQAARQFHNPKAVEILLEELENLYLGQSWDLHWKYNLTCPSPDEYMNMIDNKTGGMFRLLLRLIQDETSQDLLPVFDRLITAFGRFFQIRDDYMNLCDISYAKQKGECEDLDEGKFSYPIVYCAATHPDFKSLINGLFRQRPASSTIGVQPLPSEIKQYVVEFLQSSSTFQHCREHLIDLERLILEEISKIENTTQETNPVLRLLVQKLSLQEH